MSYIKKGKIMAGKTYNSKEVCEMFQLSAPRLLQFRKGQTVKVKGRDSDEDDRVYSFEPLLQENKDWFWDGSEVVFRQSAIDILSKRKIYRKFNSRNQATQNTKKINKKVKDKLDNNKKKLQQNEFSVQELAEQLNLTVQKIYALRDISTNKPVSFQNYLKQDKDWKYDDGKVILLKSAKDKIQEYAELLKEKEVVPKSKRITILIGNKVFHLSGESAMAVINIIEKDQISKKKEKV